MPRFCSLSRPTSSSGDLVSYEILALTIIDLKATGAGLSPRALGLEMQASECGHLTSHAMNALKRRRFIERKPVQISEGNELHVSENLFITRIGEDWLIRHGKRAHPRNAPAHISRHDVPQQPLIAHCGSDRLSGRPSDTCRYSGE